MNKCLISFLLIFLLSSGFLCDCNWQGNFIEVSKTVDIVILFKVTSYVDYYKNFPALDTLAEPKKPMSIQANVIEVLRGNEKRKSVKIFGGDGFLCRESVQGMNDNYFIAALNKSKGVDWGNGVVEHDGDYFIDNCGEYLLRFDSLNKLAFGRITPSDRKKRNITMDNLKSLLNK
ncbi:MAG: hypothetical protein QM734_11335 [Cyclobacteriaceae bacterium]